MKDGNNSEPKVITVNQIRLQADLAEIWEKLHPEDKVGVVKYAGYLKSLHQENKSKK